MKVKIKKLNEAAMIPVKKRRGDSGYDLFPIESGTIPMGTGKMIPLGFAAEFDSDYVALIWDRSGVGIKGITKHAGVIDANYRGEWNVYLFNHSREDFAYSPEKAIAQVVFQRHIDCDFKVVTELSESQRGANWKGSSDAKES